MRFVKGYLISVLGEKCTRCGWSERHPRTRRVPLELEHIDGDWRNVQPNNIDLLCPNCHSLTPTFKALNKGRGRELRQKKRNARRAVEEATRAGEAVDAVGRGESAVPPKRILRTPMTRAREAPVQPRFEFEERARR
jgi:ribosomal protein L44E